ncbi:MAG: hypothetical protein R6W68_05585 [Ignavibacteriaceae bacterium]
MDKLVSYILIVYFLLVGCAENSNKSEIDLLNHKKELKQFPALDDFYFVGSTELHIGVYKYNFNKKKAAIFWNSRTEKVIDLVASEDYKSVFFITAIRYGFAGSFPFIEKARLYRIDVSVQKTEFIRDIGNAIQINTYWTEEGNYNLTINTFDPRVNSYVIQNNQLYNQFGKILIDQSETSDLFISGYPKIKMKDVKSASSDGRYKLLSVADSIFIRDFIDKKKIFIKETRHKINEVEWIPGRSMNIFSTIMKIENYQTEKTEPASLNIVDTNKMEMLKTFSGTSLYRFAITNDFLIFDSGFGINSKIYIINLSDLVQYDLISIRGGCGLRNIPENPFP